MAWFITQLPKRKSRGLMLFLQNDMADARKGWSAICFDIRRHYHDDGSCQHTDALLDGMKPWHRSRTTIDPWGGDPPSLNKSDGLAPFTEQAGDVK